MVPNQLLYSFSVLFIGGKLHIMQTTVKFKTTCRYSKEQVNVHCSPLFHCAAYALDFHHHLQAYLLPHLVYCYGDDDEVDAVDEHTYNNVIIQDKTMHYALTTDSVKVANTKYSTDQQQGKHFLRNTAD